MLKTLTATIMAASAISAQAVQLNPIGQIQLGQGEGFAEMIRYQAGSQRLYVTSSETGSLSAVSLRVPASPVLTDGINLNGGDVTAVAIHGDKIAASIKDGQNPGQVLLFNARDEQVARFETGALPDNVAFSPDGRWLITANEGEPSDDYQNDPQGSFTLVDLRDNSVRQISLEGLELPPGARIVTPGADFAVDAEPEYVTVDANSQFAYATLQENNALAKIDLAAGKVVSITGFGFKNVSRTDHDLSNKDGGINMKRWPFMMMYQPDAIATYQVAGPGRHSSSLRTKAMPRTTMDSARKLV